VTSFAEVSRDSLSILTNSSHTLVHEKILVDKMYLFKKFFIMAEFFFKIHVWVGEYGVESELAFSVNSTV